MLKVLLAYRCSDEGLDNPFERVLPVGVGYLNAHLRAQGRDCVLANLSGMSDARVAAILAREKPGLVGISCFTFNRRASLALVRRVRHALPSATIVLGGPHATHAGTTLMASHPEIDFCVTGEGELTLEALTRALEAGEDPASIPGLLMRRDGEVVATAPATPIRDLDALAFPARFPDGYGIDPAAQYPYVVTSRGCPAACTFCSSPEFWGQSVRFRSAENILDELTLLRERFGILYVSFRDDIFALHKSRIIALCRGMIERKLSLLWDCQTRVNTIDEERLMWMKRAGCVTVQFGVESGSQAMLDRMQKGQTVEQALRAAAMTRRVGLTLSIYLISGVDGEQDSDLDATEAMVRTMKPHDGIVTPLAVFPGTTLWESYRRAQGADDRIWDDVGHDGIFVRPERFTEDALLRLSSLLESEAEANRYTPDEFAAHTALTGACHAGDLLEGECHERLGDAEAAAAIYAGLSEREPWNPWPRLRLGFLAFGAGRRLEAHRHALEALALAPGWGLAERLAADASDGARRAPSRQAAGGSRARGFQSYPMPPGSRGERLRS